MIPLLNDWRWLLDLSSEDISLDEPWQPDFRFVADKLFCWYREDLCCVVSKCSGLERKPGEGAYDPILRE